MFYRELNQQSERIRRRTAEGLLRLREQLDIELPSRTLEQSLLLATWNIRELGGTKFGGRVADAHYFIAEILSRFDLIAVQEVRTIPELERIKRIMGGWWSYLITDVNFHRGGGNGERMAFLFDSRTVKFANLAGEVVLPDKARKGLQFARAPYLCGFRAGWTKFSLCTVHLYFGKDNANEPRRMKELRELATFLATRGSEATETPEAPGAFIGEDEENLILLGDFNNFSKNSSMMEALKDVGFHVPKPLDGINIGSNLNGKRFYDQIVFLNRYKNYKKLPEPTRAGVLDPFISVLRKEDYKTYLPELPKNKRSEKNYNEWRTYQMSDHRILWVEMPVNFSKEYLRKLSGTKSTSFGKSGTPKT